MTLFRTAFPDIHFTIDDLIAEGDQVAVQYTFSGTHTGQFGELEPSGRHVSVTGILIALVTDARIQSALSVFDSGDLMHQLEPEHKTRIQQLADILTGRIRHHADPG